MAVEVLNVKRPPNWPLETRLQIQIKRLFDICV